MNPIVETIETAADICEILQDAGYEAVFAGGCVRDMLQGVEPHDIDIATSATPEQVESLFEKTVAVGKSFGVIRVIFDDEEFEIATFRKDSETSDGRRPDSVEFSSMQEDARRRDLTVNAIFFDPIKDKIHDFVGGIEDLKRRKIRFVGNPQDRIEEDKLRMLRVIRFASRGRFFVEGRTSDAVIKNADKIVVVSKERIADELTKILTHPDAYRGFEFLQTCGFWQYLIPEVAKLQGCTQNPKWHPEGDVFEHTLKMLRIAGKKLVNNPVLAWGILLHDIAKPNTWEEINGKITNHGHAEIGEKMARKILIGLKFDKKTTDKICSLVGQHMKFFDAKKMKGSTRMKLIADENFDNMLELHRCDCLGSNGDLSIYKYLVHVRESTPKNQIKPDKLIDGHDLIKLGLKPGKEFKQILDMVADEQREGSISTHEQAMLFVKNHLNKQKSIEKS